MKSAYNSPRMPAPSPSVVHNLFDHRQTFPLRKDCEDKQTSNLPGCAQAISQNDFSNHRVYQFQQQNGGKPRDAPKIGSDAQNGQRLYEVVAATSVVVRSEPRSDAKMKTKKSRGARFCCDGVTMNGWLRLSREPGWVLAWQRAGTRVEPAVLPTECQEPELLAAPGHQSQGICCFEVLGVGGDMPIRIKPERAAQVLGRKRKGELVFADEQNFNGWVKLAGEDGWTMVNSPRGQLMQLRRGTAAVNLWALCSLWQSARRPSGVDGATKCLTSLDVENLRELEKNVSNKTVELFDRCKASETDRAEAVQRNLLEADDWSLNEFVVKRILFAGLIAESLKDGEPWAQELAKEFSQSSTPRVPQIPGDEDDCEDGTHEEGYSRLWASANHTPDPSLDEGFVGVTIDGKSYCADPSGVLFDPPNEIPVGAWNQSSGRIDPVVDSNNGLDCPTLYYMGRVYLLMPDGQLMDPMTQKVVGKYDQYTGEFDLRSQNEVDEQISIIEPGQSDHRPAPMPPSEYLERAKQAMSRGRHRAATSLLEEALKRCFEQRSVDLEFECEILHTRCKCWLKLGKWTELLEDITRIEESGGCLNAKDQAELAQWHDLATKSKQGCESVCATCQKPVPRSSCCSACLSAFYCGQECQRAHWKVHKKVCRQSAQNN